MVLNIKVKGVGGISDTQVVCREDATVQQLKVEISKATSIPADQQKIIYLGRILENHMELKSVGVSDGHTVFLVRSTGGRPAASSTPPRQQPNPLAGLFGGPAGGGSQADMMRQMMNSPAMQQLLRNPETIRNMVQSNPQLRAMMEASPELRRQLEDPQMLQRAMQAASNPEIMREMTRNNDRTMANIESHPEGFNMLRRMYNEVQEPMMDAAAARFRDQRAGRQTAPTPASAATSTPNTSPLPNPWASPAPAPARGLGAAGMPGLGGLGGLGALFGSPPGTAASSPGTSPQANPFAAFGGLGGSGGGQPPNMAALSQLMQNPALAQRVTEMMSNPQVMESLARVNPQLRAMMEANPGMMQMAQSQLRNMTPEQLQRMMQASVAAGGMPGFGGAGGAGLFGQQGPGGPGSSSSANPLFGADLLRGMFGAPPAPAPAPSPQATIDISDEDFDRALEEAMASIPENISDCCPSSQEQVPATPEAQTAAVAPSTNTSASEASSGGLYAAQLASLHTMGFTDDAQNVRALEQTGGNVNQAVGLLLAGDVE